MRGSEAIVLSSLESGTNSRRQESYTKRQNSPASHCVREEGHRDMYSNRVFRWLGAGLFAMGTLCAQSAKPALSEKSSAYFNYAMGHLYAELGVAQGPRSEFINKAIDHLKSAMKEDPAAGFIGEELAELYIQGGRLREAVREFEDILKTNPNDLTARRVLGRISSRLIGDPQQRGLNQKMLDQALEHYK
ncbi:MAG: tetratricopeptide repeat protein, partial [Acidobacteria bacterium]|nr:tetratricopeptide repeat protein [Acidobacteriota bacterium]